MKEVDFLVIGSGIAGLSYAIKVAEAHPDKEILVLTKSNRDESNTKYAQGGIAVVSDFLVDEFEKHILDTLDAGDGLCDKEVVDFVIREGRERVDELIEWGARFDKDLAGKYKLGKEGGHSENRVLHHKDITGWEIERALLEKVAATKNITVEAHHFVVDIITQHHLGRIVTRVTPNIKCYGVYVLNLKTNQIEKILSKITVLGTGGFGQAYRQTTNPTIATGDGIAMVYRAKGRIGNMEFVQFHPTSLYDPGVSPSFLITEAVRGDGGILRTRDGKEFMQFYDERGSLAPRDIVARAIDNEMKKSGDDHVYLDCRHMDKEKFKAHFPNILETCLEKGIDIINGDMIPVVPAAHYACGGIAIDEKGQTSIENLYACGECTFSGLHGANRLASNSLLEALVFSHRIYLDSIRKVEQIDSYATFPDWIADGTNDPKEMVLITQSMKELKDIMSSYVGIVRNNKRLERASNRLLLLFQETEELYMNTTISPQLCELRNLITIAYLITRSAAMRKESIGLHYTTDYPDKLDFRQDTLM